MFGRLTQYSFNGNLHFCPSWSLETVDVPTISKAGSNGREEFTDSVSDPSSSELSVTAQLDKNCEEKTIITGKYHIIINVLCDYLSDASG